MNSTRRKAQQNVSPKNNEFSVNTRETRSQIKPNKVLNPLDSPVDFKRNSNYYKYNSLINPEKGILLNLLIF